MQRYRGVAGAQLLLERLQVEFLVYHLPRLLPPRPALRLVAAALALNLAQGLSRLCFLLLYGLQLPNSVLFVDDFPEFDLKRLHLGLQPLRFLLQLFDLLLAGCCLCGHLLFFELVLFEHVDEAFIFALYSFALAVEILGVPVCHLSRLFERVAECIVAAFQFCHLRTAVAQLQLAVGDPLGQFAVFGPQGVALLHAEVVSLLQLAQLALQELNLRHF
jgi:hypothetical protein